MRRMPTPLAILFSSSLGNGLLEAALGRLLFFRDELIQPGERPMLRGRRVRLLRVAAGMRVDRARMLVLVAVDAEQLPVGTVERVVVVVAVLVVDGQLAQPAGRKMPCATRAYVGEER